MHTIAFAWIDLVGFARIARSLSRLGIAKLPFTEVEVTEND
jgi:hypothetical protein